jgi:hypothetical protein
MSEPLLTPIYAKARTAELVEQFERDPDVLSPDEQALVMEIQRLQQELDDLSERIREAAERE